MAKPNYEQENYRYLWRFINCLTILKWCLPLIGVAILVAALTPQFFLWVVGKMNECTEGSCTMDAWGLSFPLTIGFLAMVITADAQTPHQSVVRAMDAAGQMGFVHLSVTTIQPRTNN